MSTGRCSTVIKWMVNGVTEKLYVKSQEKVQFFYKLVKDKMTIDFYLKSYKYLLKTHSFRFSSLATMYVTTESGRSCNENSGITQEECKAAVPRIQDLVPGAYYNGGSLSMVDRPVGCFYHPGASPSLYWNTNPLGISCSSCKSVCKQRKKAFCF